MPDNTAMTVDADLATLRHALTPGNYSNGPGCQAALARVEAELSRLREEDAGYARTIVALWEEIAPGESYEELGGATIVELATRLRHAANNLLEGLTVACEEWERDYRAAEARCAQLEDDLDRERDNHAALLRINQHAAEEWEARCARLQQMLGAAFRECEDDLSVVVCDCDVDPEATCLAHRILALAGLDTPADSQEFTPSRAPVDPPIVLPADSQEDKT